MDFYLELTVGHAVWRQVRQTYTHVYKSQTLTDDLDPSTYNLTQTV